MFGPNLSPSVQRARPSHPYPIPSKGCPAGHAVREVSPHGTESRYAMRGISKPVPAPHRTATTVIHDISTERSLKLNPS